MVSFEKQKCVNALKEMGFNVRFTADDFFVPEHYLRLARIVRELGIEGAFNIDRGFTPCYTLNDEKGNYSMAPIPMVQWIPKEYVEKLGVYN